jgi:Domain of unknown function (DUF6473)
MAYAFPGEGALDYFPCRYGASRLLFRGPRRSLERPYIAFIGATETYGKYVPDPFPDLIEDEFGFGAVNLALVNAGIDAYLNDDAVLDIAKGAEAVVVQIMGAQNLSNRFYTVHPRRNDRFLGATPALKSLFRDVDFTEFNFTRHMIQGLMTVSPPRFEVVAEELRTAWVARMNELLVHLPKQRTLLLWLGRKRPPAEAQRTVLGPDPLFVTADMISGLKTHAAGYAEALVSEAAQLNGLSGMVFAPLEAPAAAALPGPAAHRDMAEVVTAALKRMVE